MVHSSCSQIKIVPGISYFLTAIDFLSALIIICISRTVRLPVTFAQPQIVRDSGGVRHAKFLKALICLQKIVHITGICKKRMLHNDPRYIVFFTVNLYRKIIGDGTVLISFPHCRVLGIDPSPAQSQI